MVPKEIYTKPIWWLWDYNNELMYVLFSLRGEQAYPIDWWRTHNIANLEEHVNKCFYSSKQRKPDPSEHLKNIAERDTLKEDIDLFWAKKKRLDELVLRLNEEFKKVNLDLVILKKIFNEICLIIFTTESDSTKHTPFPEVI